MSPARTGRSERAVRGREAGIYSIDLNTATGLKIGPIDVRGRDFACVSGVSSSGTWVTATLAVRWGTGNGNYHDFTTPVVIGTGGGGVEAIDVRGIAELAVYLTVAELVAGEADIGIYAERNP